MQKHKCNYGIKRRAVFFLFLKSFIWLGNQHLARKEKSMMPLKRKCHKILADKNSKKAKSEKWLLICSARDWDGKDYLRIIPRVVW